MRCIGQARSQASKFRLPSLATVGLVVVVVVGEAVEDVALAL